MQCVLLLTGIPAYNKAHRKQDHNHRGGRAARDGGDQDAAFPLSFFSLSLPALPQTFAAAACTPPAAACTVAGAADICTAAAATADICTAAAAVHTSAAAAADALRNRPVCRRRFFLFPAAALPLRWVRILNCCIIIKSVIEEIFVRIILPLIVVIHSCS